MKFNCTWKTYTDCFLMVKSGCFITEKEEIQNSLFFVLSEKSVVIYHNLKIKGVNV